MNPKIVSFNAAKNPGNILGFCGLQVMWHLNGKLIPVSVKATVAKNGQTGHVFVSIHRESYTKSDGTTGYSNLANIPKEFYTEFNEAATKAWNEYSANLPKNEAAPLAKSSPDAFYPHGMAKNTQAAAINPGEPQVHKQQRQYKEQDEELPF